MYFLILIPRVFLRTFLNRLNGTAPAAIVLRGTADPILALGVFVAEEIFGLSFPIVAVPAEEFDGVLAHATHATVTPQSEVVLGSSQEEVNTAVQG